jgi:hypothetical protein
MSLFFRFICRRRSVVGGVPRIGWRAKVNGDDSSRRLFAADHHLPLAITFGQPN